MKIVKCKLCQLLHNEDNRFLVAKFNFGSVFLNWNQVALGRVMYVLHKHYKDITEIPMEDFRPMRLELVKVTSVVKQVFQPDLIDIAALGNYDAHLHYHIIPRYKKDDSWGEYPWPHQYYSPTEIERCDLIKRLREGFICNPTCKRGVFLT